MAYTRAYPVWMEDDTTPVDATALNTIEDGIAALYALTYPALTYTRGYNPWVDGVTPITAAKLNNFEAALDTLSDSYIRTYSPWLEDNTTPISTMLQNIEDGIVMIDAGYTASDRFVLQENNAEKTSFSPGWTKAKEITLPYGGEIRIGFEYTSEARIYRNGSPVGTLQAGGVAGWKYNRLEDISGWSTGDTLELWINLVGAFNKVRNLRLYVADRFVPFGVPVNTIV